jgi:Tfp pilus assembly protein PilF
MTPRMQQLRKLLEKEPNDTFLLYGIALEYKKAGDLPAAISQLDRVITLDPGYCYAYHQKGLAYEQAGDVEAAKRAYRDGIEAARKKGDLHAAQEIEGALMMIGG